MLTSLLLLLPLRWRDALGIWLYGVGYHLFLCTCCDWHDAPETPFSQLA